MLGGAARRGDQGRACSRTRSGRGSGTRGSSERDGVLDLIDGDVYTSEIPWTKPSPRAFGAAMEAVGRHRPGPLRLRRRPALRRRVGRPERRPAGDPRPAQRDPPNQIGHTEGEPDAVAHALAEIPAIVAPGDTATPGLTST